MNKKALVIEDDKNIAELLRLYLEKDGFEVMIAADGGKGLQLATDEHPDVVLLDIMLPVMDGWQVCREIRTSSDVPIIMLTAKGETYDKVSGLEMGADDYVTKPFSLAVLLAKTEALIRRSRGQSADGRLRCGAISVDPGRRVCTVGDQTIKLSPREYELLLCLLHNSGRVLSRAQLLDKVWGLDFDGDERAVDVRIKSLRAALGSAGKQIKTVFKAGYQLEEACEG